MVPTTRNITAPPIPQTNGKATTTNMYVSATRCLYNSQPLTHWGWGKMAAIFKCILLNENVTIWIKISLKFVPEGPINNILAMVQLMAWHQTGDKPLSEPMMVRLPMHICVTRPQRVHNNTRIKTITTDYHYLSWIHWPMIIFFSVLFRWKQLLWRAWLGPDMIAIRMVHYLFIPTSLLKPAVNIFTWIH